MANAYDVFSVGQVLKEMLGLKLVTPNAIIAAREAARDNSLPSLFQKANLVNLATTGDFFEALSQLTEMMTSPFARSRLFLENFARAIDVLRRKLPESSLSEQCELNVWYRELGQPVAQSNGAAVKPAGFFDNGELNSIVFNRIVNGQGIANPVAGGGANAEPSPLACG